MVEGIQDEDVGGTVYEDQGDYDTAVSAGEICALKWEDGDYTYIMITTNMMGAIRVSCDYYMDTSDAYIGYSIMFIVLIIYTVMFAIMYFKRVILMAFLTMIAPLVAVTYPIDKANDGTAQGFNFWLKEYIFNLLLQPIHLLLYVILIGSAIEVATENMIWCIMVMTFMTQGEQILRRMFNFGKAETPGKLGDVVAAGAIMGGMKRVLGGVPHGPNGGNKGEQDNSKEKGITSTGKNRFNMRNTLAGLPGNREGEGLNTGVAGASQVEGTAGEEDESNSHIYDENGYDENGYDADGFDRDGYDENGFDADGNFMDTDYGRYDWDGLDRNGYDADGYDKNGLDKNGFYKSGINQLTGTKYGLDGYDQNGYDQDGFGRDGFDINGLDADGYDRNGFKDGFDRNGYDADGYDANGFDKNGINRITNKKYDESGKDAKGNTRLQNARRKAGNEFRANTLPKIKGVAKNAPKTALKVAGGAALGVAGGTVGIAAGVVSGDMSKVVAYTGTGVLAGASAGSKAGSYASNVSEKTKDAFRQSARQFKGEEKYQEQEALKNQKKMKKDDKNIQQIQESFKLDRDEAEKKWGEMVDFYAEGGVSTDIKDMIQMEKVADKFQTENSQEGRQNARNKAALGFRLDSMISEKETGKATKQAKSILGVQDSEAEKAIDVRNEYVRIRDKI